MQRSWDESIPGMSEKQQEGSQSESRMRRKAVGDEVRRLRGMCVCEDSISR